MHRPKTKGYARPLIQRSESSMNNDTISMHFVNAALHGARRLNINVESIVSHAGIDPALLARPKARVSTEQYARFAQSLWLSTQDEHVGFDDQPRRLGTFATMCQLIIHAKTLGQALERAQQFYSLFGPDWSMTISHDVHEAHLRLHIPQAVDVDHFLTENLLMIWQGLVCWLVGRAVVIERMKFSYPQPKHVDEYSALFSARTLQFDCADTEMIFAADYLALPIRQTEETLEEFLKASPAQLLVQPHNTTSVTYRIRELLKAHIDTDMPTLDEVADLLHMSSQTVRRRLTAENKSFQGIKDNLRRDIAIHLLSAKQLSLDDVAQRTGFSETSTFHRAFKKWTGVTPGLYRQGCG